MVPLPEDLSKLGDELTAAAGRTLDERRRRRRLLARGGASALSGILAFAALAPAALGPGLQTASYEVSSRVLVRPPDRRPVLVAREVPDSGGEVLVRPPDRRPLLPVVTRRDA